MTSGKTPSHDDMVKTIPAIAIATFALDQATKVAALRAFSDGRFLQIVPGFFDLRLVLNRGAAWGMLSGRRLLLAAVSVAMLLALWKSRHDLSATRLSRTATGLLAGGIAGNLADRLFRGHVVDMLDFHWRGAWSFPVFNVADSAITVGVALLLLSSLPWFRAEH
jgi:signal peptidase II